VQRNAFHTRSSIIFLLAGKFFFIDWTSCRTGKAPANRTTTEESTMTSRNRKLCPRESVDRCKKAIRQWLCGYLVLSPSHAIIMHISVVKFFNVIPKSLSYFSSSRFLLLFRRKGITMIRHPVYAHTNKQPRGREKRLHKWMLSSASASLSGLLLCSYARNHCTFSWMYLHVAVHWRARCSEYVTPFVDFNSEKLYDKWYKSEFVC